MGKEMVGFGKRSQMPSISVSRSLQACILYSFSSFILAATLLSIFCKPALPSTKCVGTSPPPQPCYCGQAVKILINTFSEHNYIRVVKSTAFTCGEPSESLRLVKTQFAGGFQAYHEEMSNEFTFPFQGHP